jgi:hypothetical protein
MDTTATYEKMVQDVKDQFTSVADIEAFEKKAKEWIHKGRLITSRVDNDKRGNVVMIVERNTKFEIIRMFPGGNQWHVSVDLTNGSPADVFDKLLNQD